MSIAAGTGLSRLQIETIDAIVGTFEVSYPFYYGGISAKDTDPGGLSFGKAQAAFVPGKLHKLMAAYVAADMCDADLQAKVKEILPRLKSKIPRLKDEAKNKALDPKRDEERLALFHDKEIRALLLKTAADPGMRAVQDAFFSDGYMGDTLAAWKKKGFRHALSAAVAYDSCIQSGQPWHYVPAVKDGRTVAAVAADKVVGAATPENEKEWVKAYVAARRQWLSESKSEFTRGSVYRCEVFEKLIAADNWELKLPLMAHGYEITIWDNFPDAAFDEQNLDRVRRGDFDAFGAFKRVQMKNGKRPPWDGRSFFVRNCLTHVGVAPRQPEVAGRFDAIAEDALKKFQQKHGLEATGVVDEKTFDALCDETTKVVGDPRRRSAQGTSDALTHIPPIERTGPPIVTGVAATGVAAATVVGAVAMGGANDANTTAAEVVAEAAVAPVETWSVLGLGPVEVGTIAIAAGFIAAVWVAALFFRRWSA